MNKNKLSMFIILPGESVSKCVHSRLVTGVSTCLPRSWPVLLLLHKWRTAALGGRWLPV